MGSIKVEGWEPKAYVEGFEKTWAIGRSWQLLPDPEDHPGGEVRVLVPYIENDRIYGHYEVFFIKEMHLIAGETKPVWMPATVYWKE